MEEKQALWFEEVGQKDFDLVGKKCANLGELTALGMPVPRGFAITIKAQEAFLNETGVLGVIRDQVNNAADITNVTQQAKLSKDIRSVVEAGKMPARIEDEILAHYRELSARGECRGPVAVSVRSAGSKSHPGQYETVLNVKGDEKILAMVRRVWSSIFNANTIAKLVQQGIPIDQSPAIGVGVVEMVNTRCAGVGFTINPITGDVSSVIIESTWGLGEGVVGGKINTDRFVVEKATLRVVDRILGEKKMQMVVKGGEVVEEEVPPEKS